MPWRKCGFDSRWALSADLVSALIRAWESLAPFVLDTARASGARDRRFKSGRPDIGFGRDINNIAVVLVLVRAGGC